MADDAPAASPPPPASPSPQPFIQTPPDSPQHAVESASSIPFNDSLHLRLKTLDERVFDVEATLSMSVADFRAKVALATAVPVPRQRLIYRGKLLKDGVALAAYDLQDGHTVHLVAKPPANSATSSTTQTTSDSARPREGNGQAWNLANLRSALRRTGATTTPQPLPMLREILDEVAEAPQEAAEGMRIGGLSGPRVQESAIDLEPITQGILTMRTVLSTVTQEQEDERVEEDAQVEQQTVGQATTRRGPRQFFVGQWLDVKDTVNQWLESTVMAVADGKVLIHYHGWPTRWDEWIDVDSDRIAAFRTRTLHAQNTQRMSPTPTARVPSAPRVGDNNVRRMVVNVRDLMREMMPHIDHLAGLCEEDLRREQERGQAPTEVESDSSSVDYVAVQTGPSGPTSMDPGQARESEVSEVAHMVAPLFDRFGRLLMDSARYFDPLLRPELRETSQRQQERHTAALRRSHGGSAQRQAASVSASMEAQDNSLSIRDLIATSPNAASESTQPRRSIDVHIHAIVAPASLSSFASLSRGNNDTHSNENGSTRRVQTPSTPPIGRSFGFEDGPDEADNSRVPLLGAYRHRSDSSESDQQQRRAVARELDDFLSDDFFGASFGHEDEDSDDEASHSDAVQSTYRPPSPSGRISSPRTPQSETTSQFSSGTIGVIPEVAAAEERLRAEQASSQTREDENGRTSSASASSSSSFPTFLEVMRRTLSGVRNFVHSDVSSPSQETGNSVELVSGFSLPSSSSSSSISSASSLSTPPMSPASYPSFGTSISRPRSPSDSSIDEELDLDEVD
ncbi:ubiquitin family protein, putative [Phytophthora infestans T30-4]|uniref:Ubiquitin family protein, putative n=2 Tax=Phytophthora infestans TaxID=4787 RepID=D0NI44_PHYIT|nr:ubiquitin family protein, putative [Phytophthora infestans T30-4]EEY59129.1 ubiquitin family protein, putative [Phytophthora infestans T30-4]KAF4133584.1 Ubiquitin family [Phytophthora infestans]|eukprot:XP_002901143.1 ubiquitin family protein, putative [Phytophthora infestans T30-4]